MEFKVNTANQETFNTSDFPLAAWLYMNDISLLAINSDNHHTIFTFDISQDNELITDYERGKALGNVLAFFNSYQALIRRARESKVRFNG